MLDHVVLSSNSSLSDEYAAVSEHHVLLRFVDETMDELRQVGASDLHESRELADVHSSMSAWRRLQYLEDNMDGSSSQLSEQLVHEAIVSSLDASSGRWMTLYMPSQNTCLLRGRRHQTPAAVVHFFQASYSNEQVMKHSGSDNGAGDCLDHVVPNVSVRVASEDTLRAECFAQLLADLANGHATSAATSTKAGRELAEIRDVSGTELVSEWLLSALMANGGLCQMADEQPQVVKKRIRDEVMWSNSPQADTLPFRRSPLWTCVKCALHVLLQQRLGEHDGLVLYKLCMLRVLERLCRLSFALNSDDLNIQVTRKLARRVYKLNALVESQTNTTHNFNQDLIKGNQ